MAVWQSKQSSESQHLSTSVQASITGREKLSCQKSPDAGSHKNPQLLGSGYVALRLSRKVLHDTSVSPSLQVLLQASIGWKALTS